MRMQERAGFGVSAAALAGMLVACGGGGGSDNGGSQQSDRVAITDTNAAAVTAEALDVEQASKSVNGGLTGSDGSSTVQIASAAMRARGVLLQRMREQPQAERRTETACSGGGKAVTTLTYASADHPSVGDSLELEFLGCAESSVTLNGTVRMVFVDFNDDVTRLVADFSTTDFQATQGTESQRTNGTARITVDATTSGLTKVSLTSPSTTYTRLEDGTVTATRTVTDYSSSSTTVDATGNTTSTYNAVVTGDFPTLGETSFEVSTVTPFQATGGALVPSSGELLIEGANNSSANVTVVSDGVDLAIDNNGDGTVDTTQHKTWAELAAEL